MMSRHVIKIKDIQLELPDFCRGEINSQVFSRIWRHIYSLIILYHADAIKRKKMYLIN